MAYGTPTVLAFISPAEVELIGKVVLESSAKLIGEIGNAAKGFPLAQPLAKLLGRATKVDTQVKEDGKHVLKLSDAVKIVQENLTKFQEAADLSTILAAAPGAEGHPSLQTLIIQQMRRKVLSQKRPSHVSTKKHRTRKAVVLAAD